MGELQKNKNGEMVLVNKIYKTLDRITSVYRANNLENYLIPQGKLKDNASNKSPR